MGVAPSYVMNNILLEEVKEINDLGIFYDSLLVFDKHICDSLHDARHNKEKLYLYFKEVLYNIVQILS